MPNNELLVHAIGAAKTKGILNGCIVNSVELKESIDTAIKEAKNKCHIEAKNTICNLPLYNSGFSRNKAKIPILNPHKIVTSSELSLLSECVKKPTKNHKQKIIHSHIHHYAVDYKITQNPLGKHGSYIEAHQINIAMDIRNIRAIKQVITQTGLTLKAIVHDSYALTHALLSEDERRDGGIVIDIGTHFSKAHVMVGSKIVNSQFTPIGYNHVIKDIATCLHTSFTEAKRLLHNNGTTFLPHTDAQKNIQIYGINKQHKIKHRLLGQIIESRVNEILKILFQKGADSMYSCPKLTLTGSGRTIAGISEFIEQKWNKACEFDNFTSKDKNGIIQYSTALGGVLASLHHDRIHYSKTKEKNPITKPFFNFLKQG